jgi:hypothetical protein
LSVAVEESSNPHIKTILVRIRLAKRFSKPPPLLVAIFTAATIAIVDYSLATNLHLTPLFRLPLLVAVFVFSFLIVSRQLSVFTEADFDLLENALPHALRPSLDMIERLLVRENVDLERNVI